jgi:hypothetical protein
MHNEADRREQLRRKYEEKQIYYKQKEYSTRLDRMIFKMAENMYQEIPSFHELPVYSMIKKIAQRLMLNELELTFLAN